MEQVFVLQFRDVVIYKGSLQSCFQRLMDMAGEYVAVKVLMGDGWKITADRGMMQ